MPLTKQQMKIIDWVLRIAVAGEFIGHGVFAVQGKAQWISWIEQFLNIDTALATQLLFWIGIMDIAVAIVILIRPIRAILLWMVLWAFWTALLRPIMGDPIWDFIERWANWGAPLALLLLHGWPKSMKEWMK